MTVKQSIKESLTNLVWWREMITIVIGCAMCAVGFVFFINPYNIVPGGVYGMGIVLHNIFPSIQVGTFGYMMDIPLLTIAIILFGKQFGGRTLFAAFITPGIMNIISAAVYPTKEALQSLDPSQLMGGAINLSNHLMLACILGGTIIGAGLGQVVRSNATTGGTDIIAMILNRYLHIPFSRGVLMADSFVVLAGLIVIGFGVGIDGGEAGGWLLSLYSLICIFVTSRVIDYVIDGASYDKLLFIIGNTHSEPLRQYIINDMERGGTYIKASGMYSKDEKEMIFLVVSRREVAQVQRKIREIDPTIFLVVTDAYDTYGEGFKPFPEKDAMLND
ncbi:MAG: YitT family protein [Alistipes sp.]|nr:YitT family protein [Alistipes sp.]MBQ5618217.1 YitT family protein [Alistipes sp.]MBQ5922329.1 YitT family protein [Alistipes sp.]